MISWAKMMKKVLMERMSFRQLFAGSEGGRKERGAHDVDPKSSAVTATDDGEAWTFNYKSHPSTTGQRWHGFVQFFKEDVSGKDNAMDLECMVDCDCPDYRYRYAYNNKQADVGWTGNNPNWKYSNQNNGRKWRPRSQGGVGDYGVGMCKHLCSLSEYLKTVIEPEAPQPDDKPPMPEPKKPVDKRPVAQKAPTTAAPKPQDSYSDSRSGSDTLQEGHRSKLFDRMDAFVKTHPEFVIPEYEYEKQPIQESAVVREAHDRGEWWIDESGSTVFADGDVGDQNHEAVVIGNLIHEILSHFGIEEDEPGELSGYEESIKESLLADGRLDEEELACWDNMGSAKVKGGPAVVLIKKLIEDKAFGNGDPKQTEDAVFIAYGSTSRDARNYAMKYWRWKVMKTQGGDIEIQSWHLKPDDLKIIVSGVWEIMGDSDEDDPEDSDNEVGEDGYPGPRINVTVQASGKRFHDIPLAVLEKKMPQNLHNYQSGVHVGYNEAINEDYHHLHKEYRLYEGNRHIIAVFEDNTRLKFEVHFRDKHGMDREKWRRKAFTTWKSCANEIHKESEGLNEVGNPMTKPWKECFREALKHPKMTDYVRKHHHQKIFPDKGYPASVQGRPSPCMDPVNFTRMG